MVISKDIDEAQVDTDFCHTGDVGAEGLVELAGQKQFFMLGFAGLQEI